jgi:hypothetical protein
VDYCVWQNSEPAWPKLVKACFSASVLNREDCRIAIGAGDANQPRQLVLVEPPARFDAPPVVQHQRETGRRETIPRR